MIYKHQTMKFLLFAILFGLTLGCNESGTQVESGSVNRTNTGVNVRDRDGTAKTSFDQNENATDIKITADIRKRVVATTMSVNAQNIKIITQEGMVTLRGPVKTADEKTKIGEFAKEVAGADKVDNQLEVEDK